MKKITAVIEYGLLFVMLLFLFLIHERVSQVEKDLMFYMALVVLAILALFLRKISLKSKVNIISFIVCAAIVVAYIAIKKVNATYYGEIYHKVLRLKIVLYGISVFAIPDMILRKPENIKLRLKNPMFWVAVAASVVFCVINKTLIPIICPAIIFFWTDISREKWVELTDCLTLAMYSVFGLLFTRSLIIAPHVADEDGRYIGTFLNTSKIGEICGLALICVLYFAVRSIFAKRKVWQILLVLIPFAIYPIIGLRMIEGRTAALGVILACVSVFLFLHGKGVRSTLIRFAVLMGVAGVTFFSVFLLANYLNKGIESGKIDESNLSYLTSHIALMGVRDESRGVYEANSLLNSLDYFSSGRLSLWRECAEDIITWGRVPDAKLYTHNTYLFWYVGYGYIGGLIISIWFIASCIAIIVKAKDRNPEMIMPVLWGAFMVGFLLASNEYLESIGMMVFVLLQYPLLTYRKSLKGD